MSAIKAASLIRGDTWIRAWTLNKNNAPENLTGVSVLITVRDSDDIIVGTASTALGTVTVIGISGNISLKMPATLTKTFPVGTLKFDVQLTYPDNVVRTIELNKLKILEDESRG